MFKPRVSAGNRPPLRQPPVQRRGKGRVESGAGDPDGRRGRVQLEDGAARAARLPGFGRNVRDAGVQEPVFSLQFAQPVRVPVGLVSGARFPVQLNQLRRFPVRILNRFGLGTRT